MSTLVNRPLAIYAKVVVLFTFGLIFLGGLVTSWNAGMAVPDWPLSFGSLNPHGWWHMDDVRLEHSHRGYAGFVGILTTALCAWIWRDAWVFPLAVVATVAAAVTATVLGLPPAVRMHIGIWGFALFFSLLLLLRGQAWRRAGTLQWLSYGACLCVALQATLGGLRVTMQVELPETALALRVAHGCVAQAFLSLLVVIAAMLSPRWSQLAQAEISASRLPTVLAWTSFAAVYGQLILGAALRHPGAGLAIPTFPAAQANGSWLPSNMPFAHLSFSHTRVGALLVTLLIAILVIRVLRLPGVSRTQGRLSWFLLTVLIIQPILGIAIVLHGRPPTLTTIHVVNGALLLATTLLLALRLQRTAGVQPVRSSAVPLSTPSLA